MIDSLPGVMDGLPGVMVASVLSLPPAPGTAGEAVAVGPGDIRVMDSLPGVINGLSQV